MTADIDRIMRRTWRYWYEDGLAEMVGGVLFVAIGLLFLAEAFMPVGLPASLSAVDLVVVVICGGWLARRLLAAAKSRLIYPRTGYVAYGKAPGRWRVAVKLVGGAVGALAAALLMATPASRAWLPMLQGLLFGGAWLWFGHKLDLTRFYGLAVASMLTGTVASLAGLGDTLGSAAFFGVHGATIIASGALTLCAYLRQTRALPAVQDDE